MSLANSYPIEISPSLYKEIEADLEEYYKSHFSHFDRIWDNGEKLGYKGVVKYFDLVCEEGIDSVSVRLVRKSGHIVFWEKKYAK